MAQITVFVLTYKRMTQGHIKVSQGGGTEVEPKDMLFPLSYSHPPWRISPKSCFLQEAFPECQELASLFLFSTKGPQCLPDFLSCSQLGIVEGALALESEDLDLWPGLTSK